MQDRETESENQYEVLVSGMGIAGLAFAWEAARKGHSVLAVTDRSSDFVRVQHVFLRQEQCEYLLGMYPGDYRTAELSEEDAKFIESIETRVSVGIKDIERYIMRRLDEFIKKGVKIDCQYHSELTEIDMTRGLAVVESVDTEIFDSESDDDNSDGEQDQQKVDVKNTVKTIFFNDVICADGKNQHSLSLLQANDGLKEAIAVTRDENVPEQLYVGAYLTISRVDKRRINLPSDEFNIIVQPDDQQHDRLNLVSFDKMSYAKSAGKRIKCGFIGEVPDSIAQIENSEERGDRLISYIENRINDVFAQEMLMNGRGLTISIAADSKRHGEAKDRLKYLFFKTHVNQVNIAAIEVGKKRAFLAGDLYRSSYHPVGHGANDALSHAQAYGQVLSETMDVPGYNSLAENLAAEVKAHTAHFFKDKKGAARVTEKVAEKLAKSKANNKSFRFRAKE